MKRNLQLIISASAASVLAFSALAQETPIPTADRTESLRDRQPEQDDFAERGRMAQERPHGGYRSRHSTKPLGASSRTMRTR